MILTDANKTDSWDMQIVRMIEELCEMWVDNRDPNLIYLGMNFF